MSYPTFKVVINVINEKVKGKIIDLDTKEEYTQFRIQKQVGEFAGKIKKEYINILDKIKKSCFDSYNFICEQSNRIATFIYQTYGIIPEFLWENSPNYGVFRNSHNNKWFGIIMYIEKNKLIKNSSDYVEILNVKLDQEVEKYLKKEIIYPSYHMSKKNWVSIILDDYLNDEEIFVLIQKSYQNTL